MSSIQIVIPFIALTAVGWLLVVIGFGIATAGDPVTIFRDDPSSYPYWVVSLCGPFIFAAAIAHAALWAPVSPGLGMTVFIIGTTIRLTNDDALTTDVPTEFALLFTGSFLAILFWVRTYLSNRKQTIMVHFIVLRPYN